jgi:CMP-N,N'-diacetyllegionaminic acid synthase
MIKRDKRIAVVLARGGSTRLPNKNLLEIGKKSLTLRAVESALQNNIDVVLSSNSQEILNHVNLPGVLKHLRTEGNSMALSTSEHSVLEVINSLNISDKSDVMLLQPTSPFRDFLTVERFLKVWNESDSESYDSAFSAFIDNSEFWTETQIELKRVSSILSPKLDAYRTQDRPPLFRENGAIYQTKAQNLREGHRFVNGRPFVFPCNIIESVDIDTQEDYELAKAIYLGNPD